MPKRVSRCFTRLQVEKRADQRPARGTEASDVLEEIYQHYGGKKHKFEALAEDVAERIIGADSGTYKKGWITPPGSDGGSDFVASVRLGTDFSSARIVVLGQAKCVRLDAPTHGNHIARTAARLRRGWIGVFVTTSYFSESVQQEVIEDRYPVVLIHGKRLADEVIKIVHEDEQYSCVGDYLSSLDAQYESRIQQRQPEEVLY